MRSLFSTFLPSLLFAQCELCAFFLIPRRTLFVVGGFRVAFLIRRPRTKWLVAQVDQTFMLMLWSQQLLRFLLLLTIPQPLPETLLVVSDFSTVFVHTRVV